MVKDYATAKEVAEILNIDEISAEELIDGVITFEVTELMRISQAKGVTMEELTK